MPNIICSVCGKQYNPLFNILHGDKHLFAKRVTLEDAGKLATRVEQWLEREERRSE